MDGIWIQRKYACELNLDRCITLAVADFISFRVYTAYISSPARLNDTTWLNWRLMRLPLDLLEDRFSFLVSFFIRNLHGIQRSLMLLPNLLQNPEVVQREQATGDTNTRTSNDRRNLRRNAPDALLRGVDIDYCRQETCDGVQCSRPVTS